MSAAVQPSDLYFRAQDALGDLRELKRAITDLTREYADLDAAELAVDDLGNELTPDEALTETLAGLANIARALDNTDDAFDTTMQTASRLLRPNPTPTTGLNPEPHQCQGYALTSLPAARGGPLLHMPRPGTRWFRPESGDVCCRICEWRPASTELQRARLTG